MAKKNENREPIALKCTVCGHYTRPSEKNKANTPDKLGNSVIIVVKYKFLKKANN